MKILAIFIISSGDTIISNIDICVCIYIYIYIYLCKKYIYIYIYICTYTNINYDSNNTTDVRRTTGRRSRGSAIRKSVKGHPDLEEVHPDLEEVPPLEEVPSRGRNSCWVAEGARPETRSPFRHPE